MKWFFASCLLLLLPVASAQVPSPTVIAANEVMMFAGLPQLPANSRNFQIVAWNNVSKGVYATWTTDEAGLDAYVRQFGEEITPIPEKLLVTGRNTPPWFTPAKIENGSVAARDRRFMGSSEILRVYVDRDALRIYFLYLWG
jgi:hypothetical protein